VDWAHSLFAGAATAVVAAPRRRRLIGPFYRRLRQLFACRVTLASAAYYWDVLESTAAIILLPCTENHVDFFSKKFASPSTLPVLVIFFVTLSGRLYYEKKVHVAAHTGTSELNVKKKEISRTAT
jgi:hypothetical protein